MTVKLLHGDCRDVLATLADNSVDSVITSPPYWGLRSYLPAGHPDKHREIGGEPTVEAWVQTMVGVFRDVRRVLRPKGTCFVNLGDSYAGGRQGPQGMDSTLAGNGHQGGGPKRHAVPRQTSTSSRRRDDHEIPRSDLRMAGYKDKDLIGQPWMLAFALRADGWWLRQEIIWDKNNPMPESVRDRCTKSHEHIFLLTKSKRYFWDFKASQEPVSGGANARGPGNVRNVKLAASLEADRDGEHRTKSGLVAYAERKRAERAARVPTGWDTGPGGHQDKTGRYAGNGVGFGHGFDEKVKPRVSGVNPKAAMVSEAADAYTDGVSNRMGRGAGWRRNKQNASFSAALGAAGLVDVRNPRSVWRFPTEGFKGAHFATFPTELVRRCLIAGCPVGGTVLDPFGGAGTVGLVADRLHRHAVLIDLDARNLPMASQRIKAESSLFAEVE